MKPSLLTLSLFAGLASPALASAQGGEDTARGVVRRAVVVGVNDGGSLLERLNYAEDDARRMADILYELGGFDPADVRVLLGPTVSELAITLDEISDEVEGADESLFLFYYAGHADMSGLQINGGLLPYPELKEAIRKVPADVHLGILDACRSGAVTQVKGANVAAPFLQQDTLAAEGEAWIAASAADEDAQESDLLQGSFFTYYLLSGLRGAADTGDGFVSLNEAYSYAYDRTVARTAGTVAGTQHPIYDFKIQGNGDLKLTEVRLATARISLPAEMAGEVAVLRLPEATPIAEVAKRDNRVVTLALEPGRYLLRRRVDEGVQEVTINLVEGSDLSIDRWGDTVAEVASLKGADGIGVPPSEDAEQVEGEGDVDGVADADNRVLFRLPITRSDQPVEVPLPKVDWEVVKESPAVAGGLSVVPGLGHFYQGRWVRGAFFMASTITLYSSGWAIAPPTAARSPSGPNILTFLALATHAWAISDAIWSVHKREEFAARKGLTVSLEAGWSGLGYPAVSGISIDMFPAKSVTLGLDRLGFVIGPDMTTWAFGTRLTAGPSFKRWRLAAIIAAGSRIDVPRKNVQDGVEPLVDEHVDFKFAVGSGAMVRFYLTPRYFVQTEGRAEWLDGDVQGVFALGMGFHIGGGASE